MVVWGNHRAEKKEQEIKGSSVDEILSVTFKFPPRRDTSKRRFTKSSQANLRKRRQYCSWTGQWNLERERERFFIQDSSIIRRQCVREKESVSSESTCTWWIIRQSERKQKGGVRGLKIGGVEEQTSEKQLTQQTVALEASVSCWIIHRLPSRSPRLLELQRAVTVKNNAGVKTYKGAGR